ncbi:MAG TPA: hypothetical protein VNP72_10480, partial [Longimicrobium sp.]|nr:hypothetical protein [Longimicrobium sp.]
RKLFYGAAGWDEHLIPGAAGVAPLYPVEEEDVPGTGHEVDIPWSPLSPDYVDRRTRLVGAPEALRDLGAVQEVRMPDGTFVDVGHVLAGLDAMNHEESVGHWYTFGVGMRSNVDAVTWVGDLGSVVAESVLKAVETERYNTPEEYQQAFEVYASPQDLIGNIDAYVIRAGTDISAASGRRVTEILREYYLGQDATARNTRYTTYAEQVGLGAFADGRFANEEAWVESYVDDVNDAAALYLGIHLSGFPARHVSVVGMAWNQQARDVLWLYVRALRPLAAAEAAAAAPPAR